MVVGKLVGEGCGDDVVGGLLLCRVGSGVGAIGLSVGGSVVEHAQAPNA